jgi:glutamine amidotransferase
VAICIVNYGLGNPASIKNMIRKAGGQAEITGDLAQIDAADKLILPGVGHFGKGMELLREKGLIDVLEKKANEDKIPVLGICLGMQLLTKRSEEADVEGLGWIDAETIKFRPGSENYKVPNMGWLDVKPRIQSKLFDQLASDARFYFVHSYFVRCANEENILASSVYEDKYTSAIVKDNIMGVQFHPEKSHKFGLQMMKNFIGI